MIELLESRTLLSAAFGRTIHVTAGTAFSRVLGTIPAASANGASFLVLWGDGNVGDSTLSRIRGRDSVRASNSSSYRQPGTYAITIEEMTPAADGLLGGTTESATFSDTAIVIAPGPFSRNTIHAVADPTKTLISGQQDFQAPGELEGVPANVGTITAEVRWGDGTPVEKDTARLDAYGNVAPQVSHTYAKGGIYTAVVAFKEGTKLLGTVGEDIPVRQNSAGGITLQALTGVQFQLTLGTLTQTITPIAVGIEWGDGTHSFGAFTAIGHNLYRVTGSHVYASPGSYHVTVIGNADAQPLFPVPGEPIPESASVPGGRATFESTIDVTGAAVQLPPLSVQLSAPVTQTAPGATFAGILFQLIGISQSADALQIYAHIDWGDGYTDVYAPVTFQNNQYVLGAQHSYLTLPAGGGIASPRYGTFVASVTFRLGDHDNSNLNTVLGTAQVTITSTPS